MFHKAIDGVFVAVERIGDLIEQFLGIPDGHKGPVVGVLASLGDPVFENGSLVGREGFTQVARRHQRIGVVRFDPLDQGAQIGLAGEDGRSFRFGFGIEAQVGLPILGIRSVALEAVVCEDRSDLLVEIDLRDGKGRKKDRQSPGQCDASKRGCVHSAERRLTAGEFRGWCLGSLGQEGLYSIALGKTSSNQKGSDHVGPVGCIELSGVVWTVLASLRAEQGIGGFEGLDGTGPDFGFLAKDIRGADEFEDTDICQYFEDFLVDTAEHHRDTLSVHASDELF